MQIPGYEIQRQIGQGGMATAYLAVQQSLGRQVVLKVLSKRPRDTSETIERFLNEGRLIASLNHPHIITIYDIGQSGEDVFISMEFVEGGDLKQRMQHHVFAPVEAIDVIEKIAGALAAAHDNGIVHRDVKPGNILFRRDGTPLLSDFGIAKRLSNDSDLTSTGMFLGSPNYMAPEQSEAAPIDGRADIYALGVILFEMLSGERAYLADSVIDVIVMHKKAPVPKLPAGLEQYQELLNLMMAKNRRERFRDARALLHFIGEMRKAGVVRSKAEMAAQLDVDVTGEHATIEAPRGFGRTRMRYVERRISWVHLTIAVMLVLCTIGWGVLLVIEHRLNQPVIVPTAVATTLDAVNDSAAMLVSGGAIGNVAPSDLAEVSRALLWLGQHSLEQQRLTTPARDNAYYYFSRLLKLDPGNPAALVGLRQLAAQHAALAEREIAANNFEQAMRYISVGLQIDPSNESLHGLRDLAGRPPVGFWGALTSLFE